MKTTGKLFFTVILLIFLSSCSSDDDIFHNDGGFDNPDNEENTFNHYEINIEVDGYASVGMIDWWQSDNPDPDRPETGMHFFQEEYVDVNYSETFQLLSEDDFLHFTVDFWDYQITQFEGGFEPIKIKYNVKRNDTIVTEVDTITDLRYAKILKYY